MRQRYHRNLAIEIDEEGQHYSTELVLRCNMIAMSNEIDRLRTVIEIFEQEEQLRQQEAGVCCVCISAPAVRILQNCGCRILCDSYQCFCDFKHAHVVRCPYCRTIRIRRDISAPVHFWFCWFVCRNLQLSLTCFGFATIDILDSFAMLTTRLSLNIACSRYPFVSYCLIISNNTNIN